MDIIFMVLDGTNISEENAPSPPGDDVIELLLVGES